MDNNQDQANHASPAINDTDPENGGSAFQVEADSKPVDPNIVDWDGPDDAANPRNWSHRHKMLNVLLVSLSVLYVNLSTTMFAPGANIMQHEFGYKSNTVEILTISIATLGSAVGQLFIPPLSEVFGRMPVYQGSATFYLAFTVGCSRSTHIAEFLVFRLLTGMAASSYMSTGGAAIADLLPKEERCCHGPLFCWPATWPRDPHPVLGPIIGGFVTEHLGWRWTFYLVLILASLITLAVFIFMRETCATTILKKKAARLRRETGNLELLAVGHRQVLLTKLILAALLRPTKILVLSPVVALTSLYVAVNFGVIMLLFATFPTVFRAEYHWRVSYTGLAYIGVGIGCVVGVIIFAKLSDKLLNRNGRPEQRLILMMWTSPMLPVGLIIYGWSTKYMVHWVVPIIGTSICGLGLVTVSSCAQAYMIDIFGSEAAASATGAMSLLRNLTAAFLPLAAPSLYAPVGLGWGNSVLALIAVIFIPLPFVFYRHGESLRKRFAVQI